MFRSARWHRSEKNKIKATFKLQFHATQASQLNGDAALVVSVVPGDGGKPTAKLEKGIIRDGTCRWEYPVYETVKFVRDPKTEKINERKYNFIVSNGLSKNGMVGEASIDLAEYAEATKASTVALPLKNSKSNGVLHVSIQRLQDTADQREVEEAEDIDLKSQNKTLNSLLQNGDAEGIRSHSNEDGPLNNATYNAELNGICSASSGSDTTLSSSESSSGLNTPRELGVRTKDVLQDPTNYLSSQSHSSIANKPTANTSSTIYDEHQPSHWEWSADSDHGISTDGSTNSSHGALAREKSQQDSDVEIEKLKAELVALARQVDVSELELQTLRKQVVKEGKKGQDLAREISGLKEERGALKGECDKLKAFQKGMEEAKSKNKLPFDGGDPWALLEVVRQELNYEKDLNADLRLQLQKTQESNAELILAIRDLEDMLEQKSRETSDLPIKVPCESSICRSEIDDDDEEQKALEELVKEHRDARETCLLEQKLMDLSSEIEIYRRDKDELEMQMEQLALDYEILKQANHDMSYKLEQSQLQEQLKMQYECSSSFVNINQLEAQIESLENDLKKQSKDYADSLATIKEQQTQIESLENELKKQSKDYCDSLATINELGTQIESLEEELEKQGQAFESDLDSLTCAKVEQEQRAIQAEEALRKTRLNNANTAEKLQEEFRRLSLQMASTFDANEKVAMKAMAEASELWMQKSHLEEMLQKVNEELQAVRDDYGAKLHELSNQLDLKREQMGKMLAEINDKAMQLEDQKKHEQELCEPFSQEIQSLKAELKRLTAENSLLSQQTEKKDCLQAELENTERNELLNTISLMKRESEKLLEQLNTMRCHRDERETCIAHLQSEVETLKAHCDDLKHSLFDDEKEKEKLRKQVFQLKGDLKKKEDAYTSVEKKLKESNKRAALSEGTRNSLKHNKPPPFSHCSKELVSLREKIKLLEEQIKLKETALEASSNSFFKKERNLQHKIEDLESRVEELNLNSSSLDKPCHKCSEDTVLPNGDITKDMRSMDEHTSNVVGISAENRKETLSINSNALMSEGLETLGASNVDHYADKLLSEVTLLKERNNLMENELKDMQERYSEISLKFAEVEGERQQLVMTLRNLKNVMKS